MRPSGLTPCAPRYYHSTHKCTMVYSLSLCVLSVLCVRGVSASLRLLPLPVPCVLCALPLSALPPVLCVLPCGSAAWVLGAPLYRCPYTLPLYHPLFFRLYIGVLYGGGLFLSPATVPFIFLRISASFFASCMHNKKPTLFFHDGFSKKSACIFVLCIPGFIFPR